VTFDIGQGPVPATTVARGHAALSIPMSGPPGTYTVTAAYAGDATHKPSTARAGGLVETKAPTALSFGVDRTQISGSGKTLNLGLYAALTSGGTLLPNKPVVFTFCNTLTGRTVTVVRTTRANGRADVGAITLPGGLYTFSASFGEGRADIAADQNYAGSHTRTASALLLLGIALVIA
jgi:hypothetical protein